MINVPLRILLVEDDAADARLLREALRTAGVVDLELVLASSMADALRRLKGERFAAVLLDLSLPDSQGFDSFARIRMEAPSTPVLALTGLSDEQVAVRTVRAGAQDYIVKGQFNGTALARAIRYAVERQQLMLQLAQYTLKLQNHEASYRNLVATSLDGMLVVDERSVVLYVNPAAEAMLGRAAADLMARPFVHAPAAGASGEVEIARGDGTLLVAEMRSAETEWEGKPAYLRSLHDVTQRRRIEESQRQLAQMKDDFVARVSHELRTPLFAIQGFLDLLREGKVPEPERRQDFLNRASSEAHRLSVLVNDLLDISELDPHNMALNKQPFDMRELIEETLNTMWELGRRAGIRLNYVPDGSLLINADRPRIKQVLVNLIANSIKFSSAGRPVVVSTGETEERQLRVQVDDQGAGIDRIAQERLFEKFYQAEPVALAGGSGLGLYISKTIIEAHGGRFGVSSKPGKGSTFYFSLPQSETGDKST